MESFKIRLALESIDHKKICNKINISQTEKRWMNDRDDDPDANCRVDRW